MAELEIVAVFIEYLRSNPNIRKIAFRSFSFLALIFGIILIYSTYIDTSNFILLKFKDPLIILFITIAFLLSLTILSYTSIKITKGGIGLELNEIKREREEIKERISHAPQVDIFDTVQLGLNQLTEYYTINFHAPSGHP